MLKLLDANDPRVKKLLHKAGGDQEQVTGIVAEIIQQVKNQGNKTLIELTRRFDQAVLSQDSLRVTQKEIDLAYQKVSVKFIRSLNEAKANIERFHRKQLQKSWWELDEEGNVVGQLYRPLKRVGLYVPGGTAAYPSSVLMTAIPGLVAGVEELVMVSPPDEQGQLNPYTLVAAAEAGVTEIYKVGGAQAVAALAYGTETIKPVDKIIGPGNIYVTVAKKLVYGQVDIDMLAGPSEILIVADVSANPVYLAADLLSQAEHDPLASAVLVTPERELAEKVVAEVERQLDSLSRKSIARQALDQAGAVIVTKGLAEAISLANDFAPEHLELCLAEPYAWLGQVRSAGAVFLGHYSPEPLGDYYAGPNHVLPTGGTARFYSPLNVDMYFKKTSLIGYSQQGLARAAGSIVELAVVEGLDAHANAVKVRQD